MTQEQLIKLDYLFYMAIANNPIYSKEQRDDALNHAINAGMSLGYYPVQTAVQQAPSEASKAFIDDANGLDSQAIR